MSYIYLDCLKKRERLLTYGNWRVLKWSWKGILSPYHLIRVATSSTRTMGWAGCPTQQVWSHIASGQRAERKETWDLSASLIKRSSSIRRRSRERPARGLGHVVDVMVYYCIQLLYISWNSSVLVPYWPSQTLHGGGQMIVAWDEIKSCAHNRTRVPISFFFPPLLSPDFLSSSAPLIYCIALTSNEDPPPTFSSPCPVLYICIFNKIDKGSVVGGKTPAIGLSSVFIGNATQRGAVSSVDSHWSPHSLPLQVERVNQ